MPKSGIDGALSRLAYYGHAGEYKFIGRHVFELKIYYGPGYRIYFIEDGKKIIVLLCGGDKKTQSRDIQKAFEYAADYKGRLKKETS